MSNGNGTGDHRYRLSPGVVNAVAVTVTAVWALSFAADVIIAAYTPPTSIHLALMVVLGGVFGSQIRRA